MKVELDPTQPRSNQQLTSITSQKTMPAQTRSQTRRLFGQYDPTTGMGKRAMQEFKETWQLFFKDGSHEHVTQARMSTFTAAIDAIIKSAQAGKLHQRYGLSEEEGNEIV